jgi:DNA-binding CsgD family transcriptional regulator
VLDVLTVDDVGAVAGLLGTIAGDNGDLSSRRQHLLVGLAGLIGADIWYWVQSAGASSTSNPAAFAFLTGGWRSDEQRACIVSSHHAPAGNLINNHFQRCFGQHVTCLRSQIASDGVWYASELYRRYYQPSGIDDFLMSVYPLPNNFISGLGFYRSANAGGFSPRHRAIVHFLTGQVGWLHHGPTDIPGAAAVTGLSPRCREVLLHLLSGDSRKQVAHKLHISEHTVSDHIKFLHRHFGVSSRGELMAKFLPSARKPPDPTVDADSARGK